MERFDGKIAFLLLYKLRFLLPIIVVMEGSGNLERDEQKKQTKRVREKFIKLNIKMKIKKLMVLICPSVKWFD